MFKVKDKDTKTMTILICWTDEIYSHLIDYHKSFSTECIHLFCSHIQHIHFCAKENLFVSLTSKYTFFTFRKMYFISVSYFLETIGLIIDLKSIVPISVLVKLFKKKLFSTQSK